ncbi:TetR/AcrR family transcriptional regulator [Apilactobacillus timberlakei]|uniref:TetR/AcrR family transcriptional regulator n=1 Tax=Apilactobacillus timberlakei TaxID=2008380 RepID=A0ABY2YRK6_9LACO|nr:TetR/AcrR family transcriptional regulator [Apilactobacillus timberlakei]TPR12318.1 TetR/AcrR family transcriptional regulator [Apilactobacillus timberlakei]TPR12921.1 TetR/AcrR family transcriptional regulator [Apilactobacillus timberlakei]
MKSTDLRIANALINILSCNTNLKIHDTEIIKKAEVSRSTFYNHFSNQKEILNFIFNIIDKKIFKEFEYFKYIPPQFINKKVLIEYTSEHLIPIIYDYRKVIKIMYSSNISKSWNDFLENKYTDTICKYLRIEKNMHLKLFVKYVLLIIELWITEDKIENPKYFKKHFRTLCNSPIINIK